MTEAAPASGPEAGPDSGPGVRLEPAPGGLSLVDDSQRGSTVVTERVVQRIASIATAEVEAVIDTRKGWTKVVRKGLPRASADVRGGSGRVKVEVAAVWPLPLATVAVQVREHVASQVLGLVGLRLRSVDVTVADVVHLDSAPTEVQRSIRRSLRRSRVTPRTAT